MASAGLGTGSPNIVSVGRRSVSMDLSVAVWRAAPPETGSWDLGLFGVGVRVSVALFGNSKDGRRLCLCIGQAETELARNVV